MRLPYHVAFIRLDKMQGACLPNRANFFVLARWLLLSAAVSKSFQWHGGS